MISDIRYGLTAQPELRAVMQYKELERCMYRTYEIYMDIKKTPWPTSRDKLEIQALKDSLTLIMTTYYSHRLTRGSSYMTNMDVKELISNLLSYER